MDNKLEERTTAETFSDYANLLWHWAWLLVLCALLAGGTAYWVSIRQTPIYQATTLVMINAAPTTQTVTYTSLTTSEQLVATYSKMMTTTPLLDEVAKRLVFSTFPESASIQVQPILNTQLMTVLVQDTDPDRAALIANTLISVFAEQIQADQASRYADSNKNLEGQMVTINQKIEDLTNALVVLNQKILESTNALDVPNQQILETTNALAETKNALATLKESYYPNPAKQAQLEADQAQLETDLVQYQSERSQIQTPLIQYQSERTQLETSRSQYQQSYFSMLQSYEQVKLAEAQSTSTIIQKAPAVPPDAPIKPQPVRDALLAAVVGLMLAAGIVFLIEFLDDSLRDPQEITRKWGIPILGMIITFNANNGNELITEKQPRAPVSEAFRSLRTNLQFASIASPIHTLLVTSPSPEDGKTIVVGNLACVFAQGGRKVVVVDADLRRPRLHKVFQLQNRLGLTDQFIHPQEYLDGAVQPTEVKNLYTLTSGSLPPNPSELLGSQRMVEIVQTLKAQFDLVVMDSPPSLVVTDANVLASRADGVLLVIRPSLTKRAAIKHTIEQLAQVKANIVGVVLNGVDVKKSRYNYYRGYYHKYGRGYAAYMDAGSSGTGKPKSRKASKQETTLEPGSKNPSDQQEKNT